MKLSRASSYALHAVVYLAQQENDRPVASHIIATAGGMPDQFLLKILHPLVSVRVLVSIKGPNGGYKLCRAPAEISMLDIIEAVDGPIWGHSPFAGENSAAMNTRLDSMCKTIAKDIREDLQKVRISDLMASKKGGRKRGP